MSFLQDIECKEMFLFGADYYAYSLPKSGADGTWYVWDKREDDDGKSYDKMITAPFEMCWGKKKRGKKFIRMRWAGFMSSDNAEGERPIGRVHPTQKPVALASWFIKQFSEKNWKILDLFLGAGFTLLSCEQTGRICYGMEIDPKYVDVIRKRYWKFVNNNDETGWEENTPMIRRK
jgi:DNA modification methylase